MNHYLEDHVNAPTFGGSGLANALDRFLTCTISGEVQYCVAFYKAQIPEDRIDCRCGIRHENNVVNGRTQRLCGSHARFD